MAFTIQNAAKSIDLFRRTRRYKRRTRCPVFRGFLGSVVPISASSWASPPDNPMAVRRPQEAKWANGNPQVSPCRNVRCGPKSEVVADRITRARSPLPPKWVETEASSTGEPVSLWRYPSPEHCSLDSRFGRQCKNKVRLQRFQSAHSAARTQNVVARLGVNVRITCFSARNIININMLVLIDTGWARYTTLLR